MKSNNEKSVNIFIENLNSYVDANKIRHAYISLITGIEPSKLSRLMTGGQDTSYQDMEKLAGALGKKIDYFLQENFNLRGFDDVTDAQYAFYAGMPSGKQQELAEDLILFIRNMDDILGAEDRLKNSVN